MGISLFFGPIRRRTATIAHGGLFDDVFLFDHLPGGRWAAAVGVLVAWFVAHRMLKLRRRREQLRRRRQIRARLHATGPVHVAGPVNVAGPVHVAAPVNGIEPPVREIDLTEPRIEIDLRDGAVYGSEVTLESGETLESGIVGPFPAE